MYVILSGNHEINRLSRLPSLTLLFTGFRAVPAPVTGDAPLPKKIDMGLNPAETVDVLDTCPTSHPLNLHMSLV